jgi:oligopeptide transport system ATP-binding protein
MPGCAIILPEPEGDAHRVACLHPRPVRETELV